MVREPVGEKWVATLAGFWLHQAAVYRVAKAWRAVGFIVEVIVREAYSTEGFRAVSGVSRKAYLTGQNPDRLALRPTPIRSIEQVGAFERGFAKRFDKVQPCASRRSRQGIDKRLCM